MVKEGAVDYLAKPWNDEKVLTIVRSHPMRWPMMLLQKVVRLNPSNVVDPRATSTSANVPGLDSTSAS